MLRTCGLLHCKRKHYAHGLCQAHYSRNGKGLPLNTPIGSNSAWRRKSTTPRPVRLSPIIPLPMQDRLDHARELVRLYGHHLPPEYAESRGRSRAGSLPAAGQVL